ncbi:MAG: aminoacyl-tRNA hydrolase [Candidatus Saccharimonadales bacterium]
MSLFTRRPSEDAPITYTTLGMNKTVLIVGLGNPGDEYVSTRHNIGFECVDEFARKNDFPSWMNKTDMKCAVAIKQMNDTRVILCKPQTFMNLSGEAVQALMHFYKIAPEKLLVVHDELDVDFGQIRLRVGGSSAGHNGIKSVTKHLGENYGRVRVGIGPKTPEQIDSADFVLQKFSTKEQAELPKLTREVTAILSEYTYGSPLTAETRSFL